MQKAIHFTLVFLFISVGWWESQTWLPFQIWSDFPVQFNADPNNWQYKQQFSRALKFRSSPLWICRENKLQKAITSHTSRMSRVLYSHWHSVSLASLVFVPFALETALLITMFSIFDLKCCLKSHEMYHLNSKRWLKKTCVCFCSPHLHLCLYLGIQDACSMLYHE